MLPVEYREQAAPLVAEWLKKHLAVQPAQTPQEAPAVESGKAAPAPARKRAAPRQAKKSEGGQP